VARSSTGSTTPESAAAEDEAGVVTLGHRFRGWTRREFCKIDSAWVEPDAKQPLTFKAVGQTQPLTLVPLYKVIHERYAVYWRVDKKST
jgi:hypothetical protein